ncbi:hypothetical protein GNE00_15845 [Pseudomonas sp. JL972]|uniref:hypothetical protein n=1 Tax=Stutzerimonas degradans TaxID=2968968 RepID=UPI0012D89459|nr:hypothetical protein [Stutzerimonas degradans]MTZ15223.1 hypothetical protein [Stutzerimonas degradans]
MATLQEQRRAIAEGMRRSRAATGEAQRNATGNSIIEQRTGRAVADDINRLTKPPQQRRTLRPVEPVGSLPPSRGRGVYKPPAAGGTAGIASPLTEEAATRAYYPNRLIASTDGAVFFSVRAVKTLTMRDANDAEVVLELTDAIA